MSWKHLSLLLLLLPPWLRLLFPGVKVSGGALYPFHSSSQTPSVILHHWRKPFLVCCPAHNLSCDHPVETHGKRFVSRCGLLMSMAPRYLYCHTSPHSAFLSISYIFSWICLTCFYDPYLLFFLRCALINQFSCFLSPCRAYLVLDFRPHGCPVILALWWIQENKWICNSLLKCFLIIMTETALFPTF